MRAPALLLVALLAALAAGCSSFSVRTDYDPSLSFDAFRTYAWLELEPTGDPRIDNELVRKRIVRAVDAELARRGLQLVDADPDLHVVYHAVIDGRVDLETVTHHRGYRTGTAQSTTRVREYEVGTLILDLVDAATDSLAWRGSGQARIGQNRTPEERDARVREVVAAILAEYPPGGGR